MAKNSSTVKLRSFWKLICLWSSLTAFCSSFVLSSGVRLLTSMIGIMFNISHIFRGRFGVLSVILVSIRYQLDKSSERETHFYLNRS